MNFRDVTLYILVVLAGTLILCGNGTSPEEDDDPTFDYSLIGTWESVIPGRPGYPDTITIGFDLSKTRIFNVSDSTFFLYAIEHPDKYLYKRTGSWGIEGNTVVLTGADCQMIDINETTYELKPASDSICNLVIRIDTTGGITEKVDSLWNNIKLIDLGGIVKSFPIYKVYPDWCESLSADFIKQPIHYLFNE